MAFAGFMDRYKVAKEKEAESPQQVNDAPRHESRPHAGKQDVSGSEAGENGDNGRAVDTDLTTAPKDAPGEGNDAAASHDAHVNGPNGGSAPMGARDNGWNPKTVAMPDADTWVEPPPPMPTWDHESTTPPRSSAKPATSTHKASSGWGSPPTVNTSAKSGGWGTTTSTGSASWNDSSKPHETSQSTTTGAGQQSSPPCLKQHALESFNQEKREEGSQRGPRDPGTASTRSNGGWGATSTGAPDATQKRSGGWGSPDKADTAKKSSGGWGDLPESRPPSSGGWNTTKGDSSTPAATSTSSGGWGRPNEATSRRHTSASDKSSTETPSSKPTKPSSTGWGDVDRSTKATGGWGNLDSASTVTGGWGDTSKSTPRSHDVQHGGSTDSQSGGRPKDSGWGDAPRRDDSTDDRSRSPKQRSPSTPASSRENNASSKGSGGWGDVDKSSKVSGGWGDLPSKAPLSASAGGWGTTSDKSGSAGGGGGGWHGTKSQTKPSSGWGSTPASSETNGDHDRHRGRSPSQHRHHDSKYNSNRRDDSRSAFNSRDDDRNKRHGSPSRVEGGWRRSDKRSRMAASPPREAQEPDSPLSFGGGGYSPPPPFRSHDRHRSTSRPPPRERSARSMSRHTRSSSQHGRDHHASRSRSVVRQSPPFQKWNAPYDGPPPDYYDNPPSHAVAASNMRSNVVGDIVQARTSYDLSRRSVSRHRSTTTMYSSDPPRNPDEWLFTLVKGRMMVQCRAMPTALAFTRQPMPREVNITQQPSLRHFHSFMHMEHKIECPHWIYELFPQTQADTRAYDDFLTYLLRGRSEPCAGMSVDVQNYKVIIMPPGQEARQVGYDQTQMVAIIRKNLRTRK
ncbi:hypothetical protein DYB32_005220 [Aphanomyces invadans]|uniref:Spen paralogue and orthologue SPOC C-terminal domain-containing protein n=1 Tax=Aphanomyces invadans TaxID=157072 RepID=A0A418AV46_9STRA|nr:hypothetical protein DYB32_005220 [Aphanomyces invadans]